MSELDKNRLNLRNIFYPICKICGWAFCFPSDKVPGTKSRDKVPWTKSRRHCPRYLLTWGKYSRFKLSRAW